MSFPNNVDALKGEFAGASDRAAAIVAGAFLDEVLQELLCSFLVKDPKGDLKLFEGTGALATFSAKIEMSFRLGLVSKEEHRVLHAVRGIRNDFAHKLLDISFKTKSIEDRCRNIEVPFPLVAPESTPLPKERTSRPPLPRIVKASKDDARSLFQEAVMNLMFCLSARVAEATQAQRETPANFMKAHEPAEVLLGSFKHLLGRLEKLLEHSKLPEDERARIAVDREKNALLVKVHEFCVEQIRLAHAALD
jgi:hypothetical protein